MKKTLQIMAVALMLNTSINAQVMNGLKAYYPFGGSLNDQIGTNHLSNAPGVSAGSFTADRFGNTNCAFRFEGTNFLLNSNLNSAFSISTDYSFSCWIRRNEANYGVIIALSIDSFFSNPCTSLQHSLENIPCTTDSSVNNGGLDTNRWFHFVQVSDSLSSSYKCYVNGILMYSSIYPLQSCTPEYFMVGGIFGDHTFKGVIDDIRYYNRALSALEVDSLYNAPGSCMSVGTEEVIIAKTLNIYPNPANDEIVVNLASNNKAHVEIIDALGQVLKTQTINSSQARISVADLPIGAYFVRVSQKNQTPSVERLVVVR